MDEKKKEKIKTEDTAEATEKKTEKAAEKPKEKTETELLKDEIEELKAKADEFKDKWMRNVAEFDNYKKRNAKLWQDAYAEGISSVIIKVLPVGDNLDWALSLGLDEKTAEGIKSIKKKFEDTMKSLEIEEINPIGELFDPNIAEAVMQVEASEGEKSETIKQVFEKGYRMKDQIIRYAKVSVIK